MRTSTIHAVLSVVVCAGLCHPSAWGARPPRVLLDVPDEVVGDAATSVTVEVKVLPAKRAKKVKQILLSADAGTLGEPSEGKSPGTWKASFTPPRVAGTRKVRLSVALRVGKRRAKKTATIRVTPPTELVRERGSGGPLDIRAPERLILGRDASAQITLKKPDGPMPELVVSAGRVSMPHDGGDGRLVATYVPPPEQYPQVAIVAAVERNGSLVDWLVMPLYGQGEIDSDHTPDASVTFRVGEAEFGPVRADTDGVARLAIVAPPGITTATSTSDDASGKAAQASVDLAVPAFNRLLGVCPASADRMLILALDPLGRPATSAKLKLTPSRGVLSPPRLIAPGLFQSLLTLPEGVRVGEEVTLMGSLADTAGSATLCTMTVQGGAPAKAAAVVRPDHYVAGTGTPVNVRIHLNDAAGRPARAPEVKVATHTGELSTARVVSAGVYEVQWRLPDRFEGRRQAFISVRAGEDPVITTEAMVELRPGRTATLRARTQHSRLRADGRSTTDLLVAAVDAFDNPVDHARLVTNLDGRVTPFTHDAESNVHRAVYRAPVRYAPSEETVVVREPNIDVQSAVALELTPSQRPFAVGPRVGYNHNLGRVASPYVAIDMLGRLPWLQERLLLGLEVGFLRRTTQHGTSVGGSASDDTVADTITSQLWAVPVMARLTYTQRVGPADLLAGAGAGASVVGRRAEAASAGNNARTSVIPTASVHAGAALLMGPGRVVVEAAYRYARLELKTATGNIGGLVLAGGYRFEF